MENFEKKVNEQEAIKNRLSEIGRLIASSPVQQIMNPNSDVAILAKEAWKLSEELKAN
jgi:hypothetical protein